MIFGIEMAALEELVEAQQLAHQARHSQGERRTAASTPRFATEPSRGWAEIAILHDGALESPGMNVAD
jgi:hypothetical protein